MNKGFHHDILVTAPDAETAARRIGNFLDATPLIRYDRIEIDQQQAVNGLDPHLMLRVEETVVENHRLLTALVDELRQAGTRNLSDILDLPRGYQSKLFHIIAHIVDGFFGIDSRFFDLDESSHWLTDGRRHLLAGTPARCWLLGVSADLNGKTDFAGRSTRFSL